MTTTVRPRNPADLAVLVPYQLGYHPGPSVIVTVMRGRRLGLMQRHDLHADPQDCSAVAERALQIVRREGATALLLLAYEHTAGESAPLREAMVLAAEAATVPVHEHTVVREGRWYAPDCHEPCCPEEGLTLPSPADVPAVAAFVHAGVAPLPSRAALVEGVLPPRDEDRARAIGRELEALWRGWGSPAHSERPRRSPTLRPEHVEDAVIPWTRVLDPRADAMSVSGMADEAIAVVSASLADVAWRDALMTVLCPGVMPADTGQSPLIGPALRAATHCAWIDGQRPGEEHHELVLTVRARLVELSRLVPAASSPPVLTLVAHLAWWAGDGTVTGVCLERALELDPHYRLADVMMQLLTAGVRPWSDSPGGSVGEDSGGDTGRTGSAA